MAVTLVTAREKIIDRKLSRIRWGSRIMTTTRVKWLRVTIRATSQKKPNDAEVYELRIKNAIKEE